MSTARKLSVDDEIRSEVMFPHQKFVLKVEPARETNLLSWIKNHSEYVRQSLLDYGGILFRGFPLSPVDFKHLMPLMTGDSKRLEYLGGTSPRSKVDDGVYLSTEFPGTLELFQHHEMSYYRSWPLHIAFYCEIAPQANGETPICSSREFCRQLDQNLFAKFEKLGLKYVRNYMGSPYGPTWQKAYQTTDRKVVEEQCRAQGATFEWRDNDVLRSTNTAQGVAVHPQTAEKVWFNQVHLTNLNSPSEGPGDVGLAPMMKGFKDTIFTAEQFSHLMSLNSMDLPYAAFFGNGDEISVSVLNEIISTFDKTKVAFAWEKGDVLLLDNMLASHGRNPFRGERRILTGLGNFYSAPAAKVLSLPRGHR